MTSKRKKLNIFIIPGSVPFPPTAGGSICVFGLIDYLRKFHSIQVFFPAFSSKDKNNILALAKEWPDVIIHYTVHYHEDQVTSSYLQKARIFLKDMIRGSIKTTTKDMGGAKGDQDISRYDWYINYFNTSFYMHEEPIIKKISKVSSENEFDIIQTEFSFMLNLVNLFPIKVKKVFVHIEGKGDVLFDYGMTKNFNFDYVKYISGNAKFLEYSYMQQYDAILALNETDRLQIINNVSPKTKVYASPYGILDKELEGLNNGIFKAENLILIGGEAHFPNADGLHWFVTDIVACFKQRPFKKLYVTGSWEKSTMEKFRNLLDCIDFTGFVADLRPYLKNSVAIVPMRIGGGGTRTKILVAMSQGSPVVATSLSAVGIQGTHDKELLIADSEFNFASSIERLFQNDVLAQNIRQNAYRLILDKYSQSAVGKIRDDIYQKICNA